jgi:hypothetical protein
MTKKKLSPETNQDSTEESGDLKRSPLERFAVLTRHLLKVPYDALQNEKRIYEDGKNPKNDSVSGSSRRTKK